MNGFFYLSVISLLHCNNVQIQRNKYMSDQPIRTYKTLYKLLKFMYEWLLHI